jgi:hypothetical protein
MPDTKERPAGFLPVSKTGKNWRTSRLAHFEDDRVGNVGEAASNAGCLQDRQDMLFDAATL